MAKKVSILWSKAACIEAGAKLGDLQNLILAESAKITAEARDWFVHAVPPDAEEECFVCTGRELPESWAVYVQNGIFHGPSPRFPEVLPTRENDIFAPFEAIGRGKRPILAGIVKIVRLISRRH
jgi:hypothetical protein